jgi:hypothetical protein
VAYLSVEGVIRMPFIVRILMALALVLATYPNAEAFRSFRCGSNLVHRGDTTVEVILECGPPTFKEVTRVETDRVYRDPFPWDGPYDAYTEVSRVVETWYYNCGRHRFIKILTFRGGILKKVENGKYGSGESDCTGAKSRIRREESRSHSRHRGDAAASKDRYGRISIYGYPHFADVYLDGERVGDLPSTIENVEPGPHTLTVTREGYEDIEKSVTVEAGETLHVEVNLDFRW